MKNRPSIDAAKIDDVIWLQTSFLGDIIINTGAIRLIASRFPNIRQHLVTTRIGREALGFLPELTSVILFDKGRENVFLSFGKVKKALHTISKDKALILQPHRSYRSSFLARYLGIPTITYRQSEGSFLASTRVERVAVFHEAMRISLLAEPLGITRDEIKSVNLYLPSLPLQRSIPWQQELADYNGSLIGVAAGSVWGTKRWKIEKFLDLTSRLLEREDLGVVLIGSPAEKELADYIEDKTSKNARLWNTAGQTTLDDLRRIFPKLALLVTNDSSPIHYGSAFSVPTVALFGATVPSMGFAPLAKGSVSLGVDDLYCRPCSDHGPMRCPLTHFKCMEDLSVDLVHEACMQRLYPS